MFGRRRAAERTGARRPGGEERPLLIQDLLGKVQDELRASRRGREGRDEVALFEVSELVLEVNFVAQQTSEASGGVDLKVVTAGGKRGLQDQQVHKITLKLSAVPYDDGEAWGGLGAAPRFRPSED